MLFPPYKNAAFCRPSWYPSEAVQRQAFDLLQLQAARRQKSQAKIDALVNAAQQADEKYQAQKRRGMLMAQSDQCGCEPRTRPNPVAILQPTAKLPQVIENRPGGYRPGGNPLQAFADAIQTNVIDPVSDKAMQTAGEVACNVLKTLGIYDDALRVAQRSEALLGRPSPTGDQGGAFIRNLAFGGQQFFFNKLVQDCDLGPALRDFAAAERDRMNAAAAVATIIGLVGGIPSAGLSVAVAGSMAAAFAASGQVYAAAAQGQWPSLQQIINLLDATGALGNSLEGVNIGDLGASLEDAFYAPTVEQAVKEAEAALAQTATSETDLQILEQAMLQLGAFAKPGSVATQKSAQQPTGTSPATSVMAQSPFPMIVRAPLVPIVQAPTPPPPPPPQKQGGLGLPIVGLGLLFEVLS
jgi:hypothetical protein